MPCYFTFIRYFFSDTVLCHVSISARALVRKWFAYGNTRGFTRVTRETGPAHAPMWLHNATSLRELNRTERSAFVRFENQEIAAKISNDTNRNSFQSSRETCKYDLIR